MSARRAPRRSAIFPATIVPVTVEPRMTASGQLYTRMTRAIVREEGRPDQTRTILAFGKENAANEHLFTPGEPVECNVAVTEHQGILKVLGSSRREAATPPAASTAIDYSHLKQEMFELDRALAFYGIEDCVRESVIDELLSGDGERPADEMIPDSELNPAEQLVFEEYGHIIDPLLNAGIEYRTALRITDLILELPVGSYLNTMRTLREQQSVLGLFKIAA